MMSEISFSGIYPAIVTPLTSDGEIATEVAEKLLARLLEAGADGVYATGSTGEGMRLTLARRERLIECLAAHFPKGKKLLVHVGADAVEDAVSLAKHAARVGAHAIASLPPQKSFKEVLEYYKRLAQESPLPLIVYYFPEACPGVFERSAELEEVCQLPNVSAVKFTDFNLFLLSQLRKIGIPVLNGRDEVLVAGLLMGANGGIGSTYNVAPELFVELYESTLKGDWAEARQLQETINSFIAVLIRYPFLPALKAALGQSGFECGPTLNGQRFSSADQQRQFLDEFNAALARPASIESAPVSNGR